jgi:F-type H+-transporting ATPase subunit delta
MNESDLLVKGIISYLTKIKKLDLIPEIIEKLKEISKEENESASVVSSYELNEDEKNNITEILNSKFGKVSIVNFTIDKSILGGVIIKYKDKMIDLSLLGKLTKIEESVK